MTQVRKILIDYPYDTSLRVHFTKSDSSARVSMHEVIVENYYEMPKQSKHEETKKMNNCDISVWQCGISIPKLNAEVGNTFKRFFNI